MLLNPFLYLLPLQTVKLSGGADLPLHLSCVSKCHKVFGHVIGTPSFRGLVIVGKVEDQGRMTT